MRLTYFLPLSSSPHGVTISFPVHEYNYNSQKPRLPRNLHWKTCPIDGFEFDFPDLYVMATCNGLLTSKQREGMRN